MNWMLTPPSLHYQLSAMHFSFYRCIQINWYLYSLARHTAVIGTVRPLRGWRRNVQTLLCLFQKHIRFRKHEKIFSRSKIAPVKVTFYVFFNNLFMLKNFLTLFFAPLVKRNCAQTCQFYDSVFETDRKWSKLRALCFPSDQLASLSFQLSF